MENEMNYPKIPRKLYDKIEEDVVKLHMDLELSIPINPCDIAFKLGFIVRRISEIECKNTQMLLRAVDKDNERDGLSYYDPNMKTFVIWVNYIKSHSERRNGFTVMHEIGHIRLGHRTDSRLAEKMANYYAAYSLVPSPLPQMYGCKSLDDVEEIFKVSYTCARICHERLENWLIYSGPQKGYEKELVQYYKNIIKNMKL